MPPVVLTVLGCDGGFAGPGRATSGYLVRWGATAVLVDAGSGTLANLQRHIDLAELTAVVVSHEHPDHRVDLEGLGVAMAFEVGRRGIPVYAPAGLQALVYHDFPGVYDWRVVADGDRAEVGGLALSFSRTDHGPETLAVRVDAGGRSLGYSADTAPGWSLQALGAGLDLALCEATWPASRPGEGRHLSASEAGTMAREAGAARLVLTHRWPTVPAVAVAGEAADAYGSGVELAAVGVSYEV
ncbi:MAG: MBL fold metallo-hydrolase [Acidimicrobiales bacterium]